MFYYIMDYFLSLQLTANHTLFCRNKLYFSNAICHTRNLGYTKIIQRCRIKIKVLKICMLSNSYIYAKNNFDVLKMENGKIL